MKLHIIFSVLIQILTQCRLSQGFHMSQLKSQWLRHPVRSRKESKLSTIQPIHYSFIPLDYREYFRLQSETLKNKVSATKASIVSLNLGNLLVEKREAIYGLASSNPITFRVVAGSLAAIILLLLFNRIKAFQRYRKASKVFSEIDSEVLKSTLSPLDGTSLKDEDFVQYDSVSKNYSLFNETYIKTTTAPTIQTSTPKPKPLLPKPVPTKPLYNPTDIEKSFVSRILTMKEKRWSPGRIVNKSLFRNSKKPTVSQALHTGTPTLLPTPPSPVLSTIKVVPAPQPVPEIEQPVVSSVTATADQIKPISNSVGAAVTPVEAEKISEGFWHGLKSRFTGKKIEEVSTTVVPAVTVVEETSTLVEAADGECGSADLRTAGAVVVGVLASVALGPVAGIFFAAASKAAADKGNEDSREVIQGVGKVALSTAKFAKNVEDKYHLTEKVTMSLSSAVRNANLSKQDKDMLKGSSTASTK